MQTIALILITTIFVNISTKYEKHRYHWSERNQNKTNRRKTERAFGQLFSILPKYARAHWNIKGDQFFTLHPKFEELYDNLVLKIDEIAERILTLGAVPAHNYSDYLAVSSIKESKEVSNGTNCVENILASFKIVIDLQRELLDISDEAGDEGTNSQMSDYITEQEKEVWMYNSYLGK